MIFLNLNQYILLLINEEANEIAKETDKALRFGLNEHHPDDPQQKSNEIRIENEFIDLIATLYIANICGINISNIIIDMALTSSYRQQIIDKIFNILKALKLSIYEGQLNMTLVEANRLENKIKNHLAI